MRTVSRFDFGKGRIEEDVLYEGKVEVRGGTSEGMILEEDLQRYVFLGTLWDRKLTL